MPSSARPGLAEKKQQVTQFQPGKLARWSRYIIIAAVAYVVLAWLAFYFIDGQNIFGLRDMLINAGLPNPSVWYHLYRWNGPTEILQWLALAGACITGAYIAGRLSDDGHTKGASLFWLLLAVTLMLILIEDAGDPRHTIALYVRGAFPHVHSTIVSTIVEGIYFLILGSIPLYALLRFGRYAWSVPRARSYLLLGFGFYGTVAAFSGTRYIFHWFEKAGRLLHLAATSGRYDLVTPQTWTEYMVNFYLIDNLLVESIELIGGSFFLGASLVFLEQLRARPRFLHHITDGRLWPLARRGK